MNGLCHLDNLVDLCICYSWMQGKAWIIPLACLFDIDERVVEGLLLGIQMLSGYGLIAWKKLAGDALLELKRCIGF
jgi:hypothetical protein